MKSMKSWGSHIVFNAKENLYLNGFVMLRNETMFNAYTYMIKSSSNSPKIK